MNVQDFVSTFLTSEQGQKAAAALVSQGVDPGKAQEVLSHAATAGHEHVEEHGSSLLGENVGKSFFAAFAAGIVKGDGILGSLGDGLEGAMVGRIAEAIASRAGIDPGTASAMASAATPYVVSFVKSRLSS